MDHLMVVKSGQRGKVGGGGHVRVGTTAARSLGHAAPSLTAQSPRGSQVTPGLQPLGFFTPDVSRFILDAERESVLSSLLMMMNMGGLLTGEE